MYIKDACNVIIALNLRFFVLVSYNIYQNKCHDIDTPGRTQYKARIFIYISTIHDLSTQLTPLNPNTFP